MTRGRFKTWGWRIPFLVSLVLLAFSVYIRLKLNESPVFLAMKAEGKGARRPLSESFANWANVKIVLLALLRRHGRAGRRLVHGPVLRAVLPDRTLKVDWQTAYILIGVALVLGTPFFVFFGWLSDRIGRKKIMLAGCLSPRSPTSRSTRAMTHYGNPALEAFADEDPDHASPRATAACTSSRPRRRVYSDCDKAKDFLTKSSLSFQDAAGRSRADGHDPDRRHRDRRASTRPSTRRRSRRRAIPADVDKTPGSTGRCAILILVIQLIYVTMVYGPIAAFLVELFPTRIRYTSMSLPYHIGNGWFGGMLPLIATAMVAAKGNIYAGLWYPIIVAVMTFVIGALFIRETKDRDFRADF